jgi:transposase-like protein
MVKRRGKQNYQCKNSRGYFQEVKEACLYVNRNGFKAIERMTKVNHNTVILASASQSSYKSNFSN